MAHAIVTVPGVPKILTYSTLNPKSLAAIKLHSQPGAPAVEHSAEIVGVRGFMDDLGFMVFLKEDNGLFDPARWLIRAPPP